MAQKNCCIGRSIRGCHFDKCRDKFTVYWDLYMTTWLQSYRIASLTVKGFWKFVNIWQNYVQEYHCTFLDWWWPVTRFFARLCTWKIPFTKSVAHRSIFPSRYLAHRKSVIQSSRSSLVSVVRVRRPRRSGIGDHGSALVSIGSQNTGLLPGAKPGFCTGVCPS